VPPRLLEGLLGDVFRDAGITQDGYRDAEHEPLEAAHERDRQVGVARAQTREESFVRQPVGRCPHYLHTLTYGRAPRMDCPPEKVTLASA